MQVPIKASFQFRWARSDIKGLVPLDNTERFPVNPRYIYIYTLRAIEQADIMC